MNPKKSENECSSIEDKIAAARDLYEEWGDTLRRDPSVGKLLERLDRKVTESQEAMFRFGIVSACRHCDEEEGGSCCGAGIENKYNPLLLLINLLLSRPLPDQRRWSNSCHFLVENGCALRARHVLCINYLCLRIQKMLKRDDLIQLQTITGQEMDTVFLLHEAIKKTIHR